MPDATVLDLRRFLSSIRLARRDEPSSASAPAVEPASAVEVLDEDDPLVAMVAALVLNVDPQNGRLAAGRIQDLVLRIDGMVSAQVNEVIHHPDFRTVEASWRGVDDLIGHVNFRANIEVDVLDVTKEELLDDFENNSVDLAGSALFRRVYFQEFDQFGGKPYASLIGLYSFDGTPRDIFFLRQAAKVAATAHAPFVAAVSHHFFGCNSVEDVAEITDLAGLLAQPRYGQWNALRDLPEAGYLALLLPRYLLRKPWHPETNPTGDLIFTEEIAGPDDTAYLWGNPAILFARNLARSFELTGWCQYLRGSKAGGAISGLPVHEFRMRDETEVKLPLEVSIPDFRELEFANAGFMPFLARPRSDEVCVFSAQSVRVPRRYRDQKDTENAQLASNIAYTFAVSRIAHYVKCVMRDNVGSTADVAYVTREIRGWLEQYVTRVANPDDLTLSYYPFKAARVEVKKSDGLVGKFACSVSVLPHVQFEGVDVELRLDSRLG